MSSWMALEKKCDICGGKGLEASTDGYECPACNQAYCWNEGVLIQLSDEQIALLKAHWEINAGG